MRMIRLRMMRSLIDRLVPFPEYIHTMHLRMIMKMRMLIGVTMTMLIMRMIRLRMMRRLGSLIYRLVPLPEYVSAELLMLNARPGFASLVFSYFCFLLVSLFC